MKRAKPICPVGKTGLNEPSILEWWKLADFFDVSIDILCGKEEF